MGLRAISVVSLFIILAATQMGLCVAQANLSVNFGMPAPFSATAGSTVKATFYALCRAHEKVELTSEVQHLESNDSLGESWITYAGDFWNVVLSPSYVSAAEWSPIIATFTIPLDTVSGIYHVLVYSNVQPALAQGAMTVYVTGQDPASASRSGSDQTLQVTLWAALIVCLPVLAFLIHKWRKTESPPPTTKDRIYQLSNDFSGKPGEPHDLFTEET